MSIYKGVHHVEIRVERRNEQQGENHDVRNWVPNLNQNKKINYHQLSSCPNIGITQVH